MNDPLASVRPASALGYLDRALGALAKLGLPVRQNSPAPILALLQDVSAINEADALAIGRTLEHATYFNEVAREQVGAMELGTRYTAIARAFDSIVEDAKVMLEQLDDGTLSWKEKMRNLGMKLTRGSIHSRFMKIRDDFEGINLSTKDQLEREKVIMDAYLDFRGALKEAEILSARMLKTQETTLETARKDFAEKAAATAGVTDDEARARAQLARDEAQRLFQTEERRFDRIKKIADNLRLSYNVGETIMARLAQTHSAKESVYDQSVVFFTTNDNVFTSLDSALTSQAGLHESTQAINAMTDGANKSLEVLASVGTRVQEDALKAGYGVTIKAESVKKLIDAVVDYQQRSVQIIAKARQEATDNAALVAKLVDEGKARHQELIATPPPAASA
ncbi:MAG: hypothetical protein RIQ79_54 [Verrucomicrobiota bacterium]